MNQGRSKKQMETNYKITLWSLIGLGIVMVCILFS